jgi:hypothetical protein
MKRFKQYIIEGNTKYKIFCDMDGVITAFDKQASKYLKEPIDEYMKSHSQEELWKILDAGGEEYWSEMPWTSDGKKLWDYINKYNPTILTAPSDNKEICIPGKKKWIKDNLDSNDYKKVIIDKDKGQYADENSILIDDRKQNIDDWTKNGGIGILHTSTDDSIKKLKDIIDEKTS